MAAAMSKKTIELLRVTARSFLWFWSVHWKRTGQYYNQAPN